MLKVALLTHDNRGGGASLAVSRLARGLTLISSKHRIANTLLLSELENRDHQISKLKIGTTFNNHSLDILISTLLSRVWSRLHNVQSDPRSFYMSGYKNTSGFLHDYDVINLFWLQKFASLRDLSDLNKPLVITLHDMWFLTGGCSYSFECEEYQRGCLSCDYISKPFRRDASKQYYLKSKLLLRESTQVVVTSRWMKNIAINRGVDERRISLIRNYIPPTYQYLANKSLALKLLGINNDLTDKYILYFVGSISDSRKGFDLFINALSLLSFEIRKNLLVIHLGPYDDRFDSILEKLDINIIHLGCFVDEISQVLAYNASDFLVCPSRFDNTPNVIAEAHMCGLPVIASGNSGCIEMIDQAMDGIIVDVYDADLFAKSLSRALSCINNFDKSKIALTASQRYCLESTCFPYVSLYNSML